MSGLPEVLAPVVTGQTIVLEAVEERHGEELSHLDWQRGLHPGMAGPLRGRTGDVLTLVARSLSSGRAVAVVDAAEVVGYPGVRSVSIYADPGAVARAEALEAYGRFVLHLLDHGVRIIHHEVLELNRPIQRIFEGLGLQVTARLREHAYAAGRLWDVLVYSYGEPQLDEILGRAFPRASPRHHGPRGEGPGDTFGALGSPADRPGGRT